DRSPCSRRRRWERSSRASRLRGLCWGSFRGFSPRRHFTVFAAWIREPARKSSFERPTLNGCSVPNMDFAAHAHDSSRASLIQDKEVGIFADGEVSLLSQAKQ